MGQGWQTVLRARNIYGPYEKRVVMEQGSTAINGPHQGALVDTPDATWWFYHFQETHPRGRVVHLQPARWKDDWPLMGVDIDGNGVGEPVDVWTSPFPTVETTGIDEELSDEFSPTQLHWVGQQQRALGLQWQWNHNPVDSAWSLTERPGWLTLHALPAANMKMSRNMLTQKTVGYVSEVTTRVDGSQLREGDHAGLLCMANRFFGIGICRQAEGLFFYQENDGKCDIIAPCKPKVVYLRCTIDSRQNRHQLAYSTDGKHFQPVGETFALRMGSWKGSRVGLYCYALGEKATGGKARFDFFHYDIQQ